MMTVMAVVLDGLQIVNAESVANDRFDGRV